MESDKLIEAMARAMADNLGIRSWEDTPVDRGDLRRRIRDRENYDVNEPSQWDYLDAATAALKAMRDTLEPVGWLYQFKQEEPIYMDEKKDWANYLHNDGWTETPLFALPGEKQ